MTCDNCNCKVSVRVPHLSGACEVKLPGPLAALNNASLFNGNVNLSVGLIAYAMAEKCVDIACFPVIALTANDTIGNLVDFLDNAYLIETTSALNFSSSALDINATNTKRSFGKIIANCFPECCSH